MPCKLDHFKTGFHGSSTGNPCVVDWSYRIFLKMSPKHPFRKIEAPSEKYTLWLFNIAMENPHF
jgi:hypothetical protein